MLTNLGYSLAEMVLNNVRFKLASRVCSKASELLFDADTQTVRRHVSRFVFVLV